MRYANTSESRNLSRDSKRGNVRESVIEYRRAKRQAAKVGKVRADR